MSEEIISTGQYLKLRGAVFLELAYCVEPGLDRMNGQWRSVGDLMNSYADYRVSVVEELKQKLALNLDTAIMELRSIDEALARRPALAELEHRYEKVYRACELAGKAEKAEADKAQLKWVSVDTLPEFNGPIYFFVRGVGIKTGWYDAMHKSPWWNLDQSRDSISAQRYETEQVAGWCKRQFPEWPAPGTFAPSDAEKAT